MPAIMKEVYRASKSERKCIYQWIQCRLAQAKIVVLSYLFAHYDVGTSSIDNDVTMTFLFNALQD